MHFGIIAAGEGSRLAQEGASVPKPLIPIQGQPMIERLIRIFERCGASSINVVVNEQMTDVREFLSSLRMKEGVKLNLKVKSTPSSMHTFLEMVSMMEDDGRFIATTVDTIFREEDFRKYVAAYSAAEDTVDGMMAVTDFIDDEKPLYIATSPEMRITAFCDTRNPDTRYISGGIYGLSRRVRPLLEECISSGKSRMRNFQRELLVKGLDIEAFPMGKIIDVDHLSDVEVAENFLKA
ncbi:MAG: NTP transferase domain-containing protein [Muribaculaceae bacterium]|nr:NTP transferase domain-containing protein [Muribaculaceae bacterium]